MNGPEAGSSLTNLPRSVPHKACRLATGVTCTSQPGLTVGDPPKHGEDNCQLVTAPSDMLAWLNRLDSMGRLQAVTKRCL
jgi:hypothetical protein